MISRRYIYCLLILSACVEAFDPQIDPIMDQPLVVDALLTNENIRHTVTLSRVTNVNDTSLIPVANANVRIEDNTGQTFEFTYFKRGKYVSVDSFSGIIGNSYRLLVNVNDQQYESSFEELLPPGEINGINAAFDFVSIQQETGETLNVPRVNFSADIAFPSNETTYYRFDWNATYQARTPSQGTGDCWTERGQEVPGELIANRICYINENSSTFLKLFSSEGLEGSSFEEIDIFSVNPNKRFQTVYSPEIVLYRMNKDIFDFWDAVEDQTFGSGSLFDSPLGPITGNIQNTDPEGDRVIGIFEVASTFRYRSFFKPSVIGRELSHYNADCILPPGPFGTPPPPRPYSCCECLFLDNSTAVKPDYWED